MNKGIIVSAFKNIGRAANKHSPEILTGLGIASMVTSTVLAIKATPKAFMILEEKKYEEDVEKLEPVEIVKATWKCYIPTVATGVVGIACLVCSNRVSARRNAALAAAYTLSETAIKEYKDKMIETVGEEKEKEVREAIVKDRIEQAPAPSSDVLVGEDGDCLCYEMLTGRYFRSNENKLEAARNQLNYMLLNHDNVSLNEFFDLIKLKHADIGYDLGWRIDVHGQVQLDIYTMKTDNGTPCLVLDYTTRPTYDYNKWL